MIISTLPSRAKNYLVPVVQVYYDKTDTIQISLICFKLYISWFKKEGKCHILSLRLQSLFLDYNFLHMVYHD